MFAQFGQLIAGRHERAEGWRAEGRKVIGYLCSYTPEELIYAAGAVPVRVWGSRTPIELADAHLSPFFCPFARSCLDLALSGQYDYLDGLVYSYACDTMRGVFEIWSQRRPLRYTHFVNLPSRVDTPRAQDFLVTELAAFRRSLEEHVAGGPIADAAIWQAVEHYNEGRAMLRQLYTLREAERPALTGAEALALVLSAMVTPKAEHNALLGQLLAWLPSRSAPARPELRLMVVGSVMDSTRVLEFVEGQPGALVVADDLCTGSRYITGDVPTTGNPLAAIAGRYLSRVPCPTKHPIEPRLAHMLEVAARARVQGVLVFLQKFCDPHEYDYPLIERKLREAELPVLLCDVDNDFSEGQVLTRVQAFLELLAD